MLHQNELRNSLMMLSRNTEIDWPWHNQIYKFITLMGLVTKKILFTVLPLIPKDIFLSKKKKKMPEIKKRVEYFFPLGYREKLSLKYELNSY